MYLLCEPVKSPHTVGTNWLDPVSTSIRSTLSQPAALGCAKTTDSKSNLNEQILSKLNSLGINWYLNLPAVVNQDGYDGFWI